MNKHTMLTSLLIILFFVLTACQQDPDWTKSKNQKDISSSKGINAQLEKEQYTTKDTEAKLTLRNNGKLTFVYGKEYSLEKNVNGTWYEIPLKERMGFTQEGFDLTPGQTVSQKISLNIFNEDLTSGHYRIIKKFIDTEKEYNPENIVVIAASFDLVKP